MSDDTTTNARADRLTIDEQEWFDAVMLARDERQRAEKAMRTAQANVRYWLDRERHAEQMFHIVRKERA